MKKQLLKPGFEFIFALSIIAILGLPPLVLAQNQKSYEIKIINGDTTINGKDIKKLTDQERKDALSEINNLPPTYIKIDGNKGNNQVVIKKRSKGDGKTREVVIERDMSDGDDLPMLSKMDVNDSTRKTFTYNIKRSDNTDGPAGAFDYKFEMQPQLKMNVNRDIMMKRDLNDRFEFNRRNTQNFNYINTDNDGISTHISFRVSDAPKEKLKSITGVEKAALTLNDLSLTPEFSTGKTTFSFNLTLKANADVKLSDSDGKVLWTDKAVAGDFIKKVNLPMNGIYYLQVKQGADIAVKRIVKED
ncbi:T9SS type A sorting domain-containing protein [Inquilinus sp. KBS0705]|nr:T9SS type A sorting domain-containing protein [Inquilinus sp. KBS0705]